MENSPCIDVFKCFYIILYHVHIHQQAKTWGGAVILLWLICPLRHKTISKLHFLCRALWIATSDWRILHRTYCHWLTERKRIKLTCPREKVDHVLIFDVSAFQDKIGGILLILIRYWCSTRNTSNQHLWGMFACVWLPEGIIKLHKWRFPKMGILEKSSKIRPVEIWKPWFWGSKTF